DEYVCEVPNDFGTLEEFLTIVTQPPSWAPDLPIAAKGRISDRLIEVVDATPEAAAENAIDNAVMPEDDDDESVEDDALDVEPTVAPAAPEPEPAHICVHCHRDPPDGQERASAYGGAWLHPTCEEPFIRVRMMEEGIAWQSAEFAQASTPPPWEGPSIPSSPPARPSSTPSAGNGSAGDGFDIERLLSPTNGRGNGYPHGESAGSSAGLATEEYIYKNALGRLHMRVVRTAGKSFPTWYWSGGEWTIGWPKEVVPYRLPELLSAAADMVVLVCEGEKGCDPAVRFGLIATTNPGGAKQWQPELTQYFQGKQRVCVVEDNDAAGAKHTALVLRALRSVVPTVGVVRFPELGSGGDLTDYFNAGGGKPYLLKRIEEALQRGDAHNYTMTKLHEQSPEAQTRLWQGHLPIGALELLTGQISVGKSLLQCDLIARIKTGRGWPDGASGPEPGQVIILSAEDRVSDYVRRLTAAGADLARA